LTTREPATLLALLCGISGMWAANCRKFVLKQNTAVTMFLRGSRARLRRCQVAGKQSRVAW
jgi:hypothetical protein